MAINVNAVYKTVLLILNQQQRGYMTPDEFNKVATQVQLNIFERYEDDLNQMYRVPQNDTEYADRVKNIEDNLQYFQRTGTTTGTNPFTLVPGTTPFNDQPGAANVTDTVYRLGSIIYQDAELSQYAQRNEILQILKSPLTQPTKSFPIYLYENNLVYVYPTTIINSAGELITFSYLKTPADVVWGFGVGSLGQFEYSAGLSVNFE